MASESNGSVSASLVKLSIAFYPDDYAGAHERSTELFGRRGIALYVRKLVQRDKAIVTAQRAAGAERATETLP